MITRCSYWNGYRVTIVDSNEFFSNTFLKKTEKIEVWLIIVYYNIALVLVLTILKKLIHENTFHK